MNDRELVFVHGRAQEFKDADTLKASWIESFKEGLAKSGLSLPIALDRIRFPYYGQTLHDLVEGASEADAAAVIVRGNDDDEELLSFASGFAAELREKFGITDQMLRDTGGNKEVIEKGLLNWEWVHTVLKAVDRYIPGGSSAALALATNDVYKYLSSPGLNSMIDSGVRSAFNPGVETVVVSHSLGTVVAYNVLNKEADANGWRIPLHVTLGSPLGVKVIKDRLSPLRRPQNLGSWFNAMDERDVVALYPLTPKVFGVTPPIENKTDVDNQTSNRHGITGYLNDAEVARRIHEALTSP